MEAIGIGLETIGKAIGDVADACASICGIGIIACTFLMFMDKLSIDDIKEFFNKRRKY